MIITTLVENGLEYNTDLDCEHGLSLLIEVKGKRILFDTGQTGLVIANANKLNTSLMGIDYLILSHGHYDHTGGVESLINQDYCKESIVFVGNGFFDEKYKLAGQDLVFIGNNFTKELFSTNQMNVHEIDASQEIEEGVWLFRDFHAKSTFDGDHSKFRVKKKNRLVPDDFSDELALVINTPKGLVIIVGCSHPGIANIVSTIQSELNMPIYAVIGGSHLVDADEKKIENTIAILEELKIKKLYLSHCTGNLATKILKEKYGENFIPNHTGNQIRLE